MGMCQCWTPQNTLLLLFYLISLDNIIAGPLGYYHFEVKARLSNCLHVLVTSKDLFEIVNIFQNANPSG